MMNMFTPGQAGTAVPQFPLPTGQFPQAGPPQQGAPPLGARIANGRQMIAAFQQFQQNHDPLAFQAQMAALRSGAPNTFMPFGQGMPHPQIGGGPGMQVMTPGGGGTGAPIQAYPHPLQGY